MNTSTGFALFSLFILIAGSQHVLVQQTREQTATINVDFKAEAGEMSPIWAWFGHDEPNYTYMKDGRKLLAHLAALSPTPVHMRVHNLLTTGNGEAALKWGSTNAYNWV